MTRAANNALPHGQPSFYLETKESIFYPVKARKCALDERLRWGIGLALLLRKTSVRIFQVDQEQ
jgi:hypothetical protein